VRGEQMADTAAWEASSVSSPRSAASRLRGTKPVVVLLASEAKGLNTELSLALARRCLCSSASFVSCGMAAAAAAAARLAC